MDVKLPSAEGSQMIKNDARRKFITFKHNRTTKRETISISQVSILISQKTVDTIGKLESIGKITLYVVSQG